MYFSQSTEHDSKKWNDGVLEFTSSITLEQIPQMRDSNYIHVSEIANKS